MTTPDLRSLTSGSADFSEEIDEAGQVALAGAFTPGPSAGQGPPSDSDIRGVLTIDRDLGPVNAAPKPKGSKRRLAELRASVRRLSEMVPNELERIRRRRVQWLGDL